MPLYPILIVAIVLLADSAPPPLWPDLPEGWVLGLAWGPVALILFAFWMIERGCRKRLLAGQFPKPILHSERAERIARSLILIVHAKSVFLLGHAQVIRNHLGDLILIDEIIIMLPTLIGVVLLWWIHEPLERRLREAMLIRRLDEGKPLYAIPGRWRHVFMQTRLHLLMLLIPLLLIVGLVETIGMLLPRWIDGPNQGWATDLASFGAGLLIFLLAPLLMRFILHVEPLGEGPVRDDLTTVCERHRVRVRDILLWNTGGMMINAAVMGVVGHLRFVLLTDGLLETMRRSEVIAVMAHEIGHIRRHHLPWLLGALMALLMTTLSGAYLVLNWWMPARTSVEVDQVAPLELIITAIGFVLTLLVFGWISRRLERQADTFAVQHICGLGDEDKNAEEKPRITEEAVQTMRSALGAIAHLNSVAPTRRSWRHGSIRWRQDYLQTLINHPLTNLPIDRTVRRIKLAIALLIISVMATGAIIIKPWEHNDRTHPDEMTVIQFRGQR